MQKKIKIALAGQPNCGKSTIFNMLSGAKQHIANYPGVTVDKKTSYYSTEKFKIELIDLPGTYSLTSFSLEERVARDFIINENPDLILDVLDASNLKRNLYLTLQLIDIDRPIALILNMTDIAQKRGIKIDAQKLCDLIGVYVVSVVGSSGKGKDEINKTIIKAISYPKKPVETTYGELEPHIQSLTNKIKDTTKTDHPPRWMAIKLLENDNQTNNLLKDKTELIEEVTKIKNDFNKNGAVTIQHFIASKRYNKTQEIIDKCTTKTKTQKQTITDKIDHFVLNKWLAFPIMAFIIFSLYQLAIVYGYELTNYTWPFLAAFKNFVSGFLPEPNFHEVPYLRDFGIWIVNSINALLNYIPIFLILFALIAILEDVGYMPRMAFVLDRAFRYYGLHGQSTLPLVLGGVFAGGCAVPGVMSTKAIADPRARLATILTVPLMNCLAKIPFYTLIVTAFFVKTEQALVFFIISTITIFFAMSVAKVLTLTVLRNEETAPFVMELPPYHIPTIKGVLIRAIERVWMYIKKIMTIVIAVAVVLFVLIQFPGLNDETKMQFNKKANIALEKFYKITSTTKYAQDLDEKHEVVRVLNLYNTYKMLRMNIKDKEDLHALNAKMLQKYPKDFRFIKSKDKQAKKINRGLRKLSNTQKRLLRQMKNLKVENSLLGMSGRFLEPLTQFAGFDWKINIAFLSSFAARESSVATLGAIYEGGAKEDIKTHMSAFTSLHAIAIILFMALTPPCIATMIVIRYQTNSYLWMIFATFYPIVLGLIISSLVFTIGTAMSIDGLSALVGIYIVAIVITIMLGFIKNKPISLKGKT